MALSCANNLIILFSCRWTESLDWWHFVLVSTERPDPDSELYPPTEGLVAVTGVVTMVAVTEVDVTFTEHYVVLRTAWMYVWRPFDSTRFCGRWLEGG